MFTLHNGDCLQVMPTIPSGSIDAIITDLPYGTTACKWDTIIPFEPMWKEVKRVLKPNGAFITTASQPFTSALIMSNPKVFRYEWIWEKDRASGYLDANRKPLKSHENICVFYWKLPVYNPQKTSGHKPANKNGKNGKPSPVYHKHETFIKGGSTERFPRSVQVFFTANSAHKIYHSSQKPVALYEYLIRTYTNEGETVLDIAMGSGTTIEAAERTGRNSIGIEKDEGIFQTAVLRLNSLTPSNNRLHLTGGTVPAQRDLFTPEDLPSEGKLPAPTPRR